jgi:hypothetical protein
MPDEKRDEQPPAKGPNHREEVPPSTHQDHGEVNASQIGDNGGSHKEQRVDWMLVFNGILAFTALVGSILVIWQLVLTRDSNRATWKAVNDAEDARREDKISAGEAAKLDTDRYKQNFEAAKTHIDAILTKMQESNGLTRQGVGISKTASAASHEAMVITSQPYLALNVEPLKIEPVSQPASIETFVRLKNEGRTRARNATRCFLFDVEPKAPNLALLDICKKAPDPTPMDMVPNQQINGHAEQLLTDLDREALISGDRKLFLLGWITYDDDFRRSIGYPICFYWAKKDGSFYVCTERQQHGAENYP